MHKTISVLVLLASAVQSRRLTKAQGHANEEFAPVTHGARSMARTTADAEHTYLAQVLMTPGTSPLVPANRRLASLLNMMSDASDDSSATSAPAEPTEEVVEKKAESTAPTATMEKKDAPKKQEKKNVPTDQGLFAPAVLAAKKVMGEQELKELRANVIGKHSKVIADFVDTSESAFGQIVLKRMFEYADKDSDGQLTKEEVRDALNDLGFNFLDDKNIDKIMNKADKDKNEVIDFEEFVLETPKALRMNLVKLAKNNGHDLGFLA
jgi:hypothetical protein